MVSAAQYNAHTCICRHSKGVSSHSLIVMSLGSAVNGLPATGGREREGGTKGSREGGREGGREREVLAVDMLNTVRTLFC